jgi:hypothetical protein
VSGLRALRGLVASWRPGGPSSGADAAAAVCAAWPEVVGAAVAARTRPARLRDGLLTIWTAGSAWSHQLSFLEPAILESLRSRVPDAGVKRLRFMVASGRTRQLLDGAAARSSPAARAKSGNARGSDDAQRAHDFEIAPDPASIVQRLRGRQAALDARREHDGWTRCSTCADWMPPDSSQGAVCVRCAEEARRRADGALERALFDAPWQSARDVCAAVEGAGPHTSACAGACSPGWISNSKAHSGVSNAARSKQPIASRRGHISCCSRANKNAICRARSSPGFSAMHGPMRSTCVESRHHRKARVAPRENRSSKASIVCVVG